MNKTILIVDDDSSIRETYTDLFELNGINVISAADGYQALFEVGNHRVDLVLLDIKMPGLDGVETYKKLKTINPTVPVLGMTATINDKSVDMLVKEGAIAVLQKPFSVDDVMRCFRSISG